MPRFQQSFNAMGPRSAAFAFVVLLSRWLSNIFCGKHSTEIAVLSSSSQDLDLDQISSSQCSVHEDDSGLAPFFKCGTLQAAIHFHVHWLHQPVGVSQRIKPHVSGKETDFRQRSSSRALNPLLGGRPLLAELHAISYHPMQLLQRSLGDRTLPHRDVAT